MTDSDAPTQDERSTPSTGATRADPAGGTTDESADLVDEAPATARTGDPSTASERAVGADDAVLSVSGVGHRFGDLRVLEDVSFDLEPGTVTAIVGPNGCGKTTLLRIVAGVLTPTTGTVERPAVARPHGYLPQRPDFRPAFTVRETLRFYGSLLEEPVDVDAALDGVGLRAVGDRRVDELSGGMRRLLGLAQATLGHPPLVLLDEPTGDLDPRMTEYMFETIMQREDDAAVLLATHNLSGAADADRVVVVDDGRVVAHASPAAMEEETGSATFREGFFELVGTDPTIGRQSETDGDETPPGSPADAGTQSETQLDDEAGGDTA